MKRLKAFRRRSGEFSRDESGSATIEAVMWLPVVMAAVIFMADAAMILMNKARIMRLLHEGNRAFAVGIIQTCPDLVTWLETNAQVIAPSAQASCDTSSVIGISIAQVNVPTSELDLSGASGMIGNRVIGIRVNHVLEDI